VGNIRFADYLQINYVLEPASWRFFWGVDRCGPWLPLVQRAPAMVFMGERFTGVGGVLVRRRSQ